MPPLDAPSGLDAAALEGPPARGGAAPTGNAPPWLAATQALLDRVGCRDAAGAAASLDQLAEHLKGSGVDFTRAGDGLAGAGTNVLGWLIERDNGSWAAVVGGLEDGHVLRPDGANGPAVSGAERDHPHQAWVLRERRTDLGSVRPFLARHRRHFVDLFIAALVINVFALVLPLFSSFVYDKVLGNGIFETLWALVAGLALFAGIEMCVRVLRVHVAERFALESEVEIDAAVFRKLLDTHSTRMPAIGSLLEQYKQILAHRDFLSSSYVLAIADLPFILLFLAAIAVVSGPLVLVALGSGALMLGTSLLFTNAILGCEHEARAAGERRFTLLTDVLGAREAVTGGALRNRLLQRWRAASVAAVQAASRSRYWRGMSGSVMNSISYLSFVGVLVGGVYLVEGHALTSGGLLAASMLTSRSVAGFSSLVTLLLRYREFRVALRELNQVLPASETVPTRQHGRLRGDIRLDNLSCTLRRGDRPVLRNIELFVPHGQIVGIAGAPGAGKTTLLRLVAGILAPDEGRILIDGIPLADLCPDDLTLNLAYKPQDLCLLEGSVEDNVRAGRPPLEAEERRELLLRSGLGRAFEEGSLHWNTEVGARGNQLSGGQRQLVALARAFHTSPPVVLLDEPTNGLDAALEVHLARQIAALRGRSTVLVSSHSRNLLEICDRIVVVGQSRLLADGPREKILV